MVHKGTSSFTGRSTVAGFDLAWFGSLFSKCLCVFLVTFFSLLFSELSLLELALDVIHYH